MTFQNSDLKGRGKQIENAILGSLTGQMAT